MEELGLIYSFGVNNEDAWQLGQGYEEDVREYPYPTPIPALCESVVVDGAVGWGHSVVFTGFHLEILHGNNTFFRR